MSSKAQQLIDAKARAAANAAKKAPVPIAPVKSAFTASKTPQAQLMTAQKAQPVKQSISESTYMAIPKAYRPTDVTVVKPTPAYNAQLAKQADDFKKQSDDYLKKSESIVNDKAKKDREQKANEAKGGIIGNTLRSLAAPKPGSSGNWANDFLKTANFTGANKNAPSYFEKLKMQTQELPNAVKTVGSKIGSNIANFTKSSIVPSVGTDNIGDIVKTKATPKEIGVGILKTFSKGAQGLASIGAKSLSYPLGLIGAKGAAENARKVAEGSDPFSKQLSQANEFQSAGERKGGLLGDVAQLGITGISGASKNIIGSLARAATKEEVMSIAERSGIKLALSDAEKIATTRSPEEVSSLLNRSLGIKTAKAAEISDMSGAKIGDAVESPVARQAAETVDNVPVPKERVPKATTPIVEDVQGVPKEAPKPLEMKALPRNAEALPKGDTHEVNRLYTKLDKSGKEKVFANVEDGSGVPKPVEIGSFDEAGKFVEKNAEDGRKVSDVLEETATNLREGKKGLIRLDRTGDARAAVRQIQGRKGTLSGTKGGRMKMTAKQDAKIANSARREALENSIDAENRRLQTRLEGGKIGIDEHAKILQDINDNNLLKEDVRKGRIDERSLTDQIAMFEAKGHGTVDHATRLYQQARDFNPPVVGQTAPKGARLNAPESPLLQEAGKYKSAEEFIKAHRPLFRGDTTTEIRTNKAGESAFSVDRSVAEEFAKKTKGGVVNEAYLKPGSRVLDPMNLSKEERAGIMEYADLDGRKSITASDMMDFALDEKYDAVDFTKSRKGLGYMQEVKVLNRDALQTKSQLTDLYNKSQGGKKGLLGGIMNKKTLNGFIKNPLYKDAEKYGLKESDIYIDFPDILGDHDGQFSKFKNLFKNPKLRSPSVKDALMNGDAEKLRRELVSRGVITSSEVDNMLYSRENTIDEVLDQFKNKLSKEDPGLMSGRKVAKNLGLETSQLPKKEKPELLRQSTRQYSSIPPRVSNSSYGNSTTELEEGQEPKTMGALRRFFTGGEKVLNRSGEGGKKMAEVMQTQRKAEDLLRGRWNVHVDRALEGMDKKQLENFDAVIRGEANPMDAKVSGASKSIRNLLNSIGKTAEEMKFEIKNSSGSSVPFKMRENYAPQMYNFNELAKGKQRQAALDHLVKSGQARNLGEATRILDNFIKKNAERRFGNLERAREIDLPTFIRDPKEYLKKYVQSAARRFTEAEHFGKKDEIISGHINKIAQDGGDYNSAQRIFDYTTKGAPQNKVVNALTQYNIATSLDLSAITNATQSINTAAKAGLLNTGKGILSSFTKKGRELAEMAGVEEDFIHSKETGVDLNKIVKFVMWPFKKVEKFNRITSTNAGVFRAQELAQKEMTDFTKRELESLGIDPASIKNGRLSKDQMLSAAYEMTRKTQFKVDTLDVPTAWKDPAGKLVTQFQSFSFMQTKFIRDEILKEASKGNFAPLVRFIPLAIGASYATNYVRNFVTGRDPNEANKMVDIRAWDKWGKAFGDFATNKIIQGKFLYDTYNSPFNTPMKKLTRTAGSILGPTIGKGGSILNAIEAIPNQKEKNLYLRKSGKEQDPYLEAKRFGSGEIPFVGESVKNKFFSYPKSTATDERKQQNKDVYGLADELGKLPFGSKEADVKVRAYLESISNQDERKRQAYILNQNGVNTKGISTSDNIIKGTPIVKKILDMANTDEESAIQYVLKLSKEDQEAVEKTLMAEQTKNTKEGKMLMQPVVDNLKQLMQDGNETEIERIIGTLSDEEVRNVGLVLGIKL